MLDKLDILWNSLYNQITEQKIQGGDTEPSPVSKSNYDYKYVDSIADTFSEYLHSLS